MDTIIIVIKDSDDCLRLKEFLSSDYHIVICSELENIIDNLNDNRIVAIIMDLDDATEVNVAKYSSYKNIDNIHFRVIFIPQKDCCFEEVRPDIFLCFQAKLYLVFLLGGSDKRAMISLDGKG